MKNNDNDIMKLLAQLLGAEPDDLDILDEEDNTLDYDDDTLDNCDDGDDCVNAEFFDNTGRLLKTTKNDDENVAFILAHHPSDFREGKIYMLAHGPRGSALPPVTVTPAHIIEVTRKIAAEQDIALPAPWKN